MERPARVVNYYILCNKLKNLVRTGWAIWHVDRERIESVAEHVYGTQMLAIAMYSEYQYDFDLEKVILMLAIHELEEISIGDYTPFDITEEEKQKLGHAAIHKTLEGLSLGDKLEKIILEYDERITPESKFAHFCDKLEADIQGCLYDQEGCIKKWPPEPNRLLSNPAVQKSVEGSTSFSDAWLRYGRQVDGYDDNFLEVSNYLSSRYSPRQK